MYMYAVVGEVYWVSSIQIHPLADGAGEVWPYYVVILDLSIVCVYTEPVLDQHILVVKNAQTLWFNCGRC